MTSKKTTKKTTGTKAAKTSAPKEKRVKSETVVETVAVVAPVVVAPVEVVEAQPALVMPKHEVEQLVREAAFLFAKRRQFRGGSPAQDWFAAEALVNERLVAQGFTVGA